MLINLFYYYASRDACVKVTVLSTLGWTSLTLMSTQTPLNLPFLQYVPVYPGAHEQVYPLTPSIHVPSLAHMWWTHSSTSTNHCTVKTTSYLFQKSIEIGWKTSATPPRARYWFPDRRVRHCGKQIECTYILSELHVPVTYFRCSHDRRILQHMCT